MSTAHARGSYCPNQVIITIGAVCSGPSVAEKGGIMDGWEILAWLFFALVIVLRVAIVVGIVAIVVAIVRGVLADKPTPHAA